MRRHRWAGTNGGLGTALSAPFDNTSYFFSWRPIMVSPISAGALFSFSLKINVGQIKK